jgi:hypothetical protein
MKQILVILSCVIEELHRYIVTGKTGDGNYLFNLRLFPSEIYQSISRIQHPFKRKIKEIGSLPSRVSDFPVAPFPNIHWMGTLASPWPNSNRRWRSRGREETITAHEWNESHCN